MIYVCYMSHIETLAVPTLRKDVLRVLIEVQRRVTDLPALVVAHLIQVPDHGSHKHLSGLAAQPYRRVTDLRRQPLYVRYFYSHISICRF